MAKKNNIMIEYRVPEYSPEQARNFLLALQTLYPKSQAKNGKNFYEVTA